MKTLVINRAQDKKRFNFQQQQLAELGITFERMDAVDKANLTEDMESKYPGTWQRPLRDGEIACNLSHLKCWQTVAAQSEPILILEDDAVICDQIKDILNKLQHTNRYNYVSLEVKIRAKFISITCTPLLDSYTLHDLIYDKGGAAGYILWPEGAKKLIEHIEVKGLAPADALIAECKSLTHGQVRPAPILQLDVCPLYNLPQHCDPTSIIRVDRAPPDNSDASQSISIVPRPRAKSTLNYFNCKLNRIKAQIYRAFTTHVRSMLSSDIEEINIGIDTEDFKIYQNLPSSGHL